MKMKAHLLISPVILRILHITHAASIYTARIISLLHCL